LRSLSEGASLSRSSMSAATQVPIGSARERRRQGAPYWATTWPEDNEHEEGGLRRDVWREHGKLSRAEIVLRERCQSTHLVHIRKRSTTDRCCAALLPRPADCVQGERGLRPIALCPCFRARGRALPVVVVHNRRSLSPTDVLFFG